MGKGLVVSRSENQGSPQSPHCSDPSRCVPSWLNDATQQLETGFHQRRILSTDCSWKTDHPTQMHRSDQDQPLCKIEEMSAGDFYAKADRSPLDSSILVLLFSYKAQWAG